MGRDYGYRFVIYQDARGEYRWRLLASNGKTVADCAEGYATRGGVRNAIAALQRRAGEAKLERAGGAA